MTNNTMVFVGSRIRKWCMVKTVIAFSVLLILSTLFSATWIYETNRKGPKVGNNVYKAKSDMLSPGLKRASYHKPSSFPDNISMGKRIYHGDILQNKKNAFNELTSGDQHALKKNRKTGPIHNKGRAYTGANISLSKKEDVGKNIRSRLKHSHNQSWSNMLQYSGGKINVTESNENNDLEDWRINVFQSLNPSNIYSPERFELINLSRIKIGILIPSSSRRIQNPSLYDLPLVRISIPSLYMTFEKKYFYKIYIGVDKGDRLENFQDELQTMFDCVVIVYSLGKTFVQSVNTIAEKAYNDGMDYLVRINDDTKFLTENWTSLAIEKLREYVPQNIGVVGPTCYSGNVYILTHDMVHRTHLEIFNFYYPPYFENWWADDWITRVYEPGRSSKLQSWTVKHFIGESRYTVDFEREKWVETIIRFDKIRLRKYLGY